MCYLREITWVIDRTLESVGNATTFVEVDSVGNRSAAKAAVFSLVGNAATFVEVDSVATFTHTSAEVDSVVSMYVGTLVMSVNCARILPEATWKSVEPILAITT